MLTYICIKNYLTVTNLELHFKNGMSAITGETGSGKSILIGALNTTLGQPASIDLISKGADKLEVITIFNIKELKNVKEYLEEFEFYDGDELILRRVLSSDGKNKCFINSNVCKVSDLKKLSDLLLTFHDQNQQHNLVKPKRQLSLLDNYSNNNDLLLEVKNTFNKIKEEKTKLFNMKNNFEESNALFQLLTYQVNEIQELDIKPNETLELEDSFKKLSKASDYISELNTASQFLDNDTEQNILGMIFQVKKHLENVEDNNPKYKEIYEMIESSYINIKEATHMLEDYAQSFEVDPEKLNEVSDRLDQIYTIAKKHKIQPEKISVLYRELNERLNGLEYSELDLEKTEEKIEELTQYYLVKAKELRSSRILSIPALEKEINEELVKLKFNKDTFSINLEPILKDYQYDSEDQFTETGIDRVDFYIQPNLGQDKQLLSKSASGGELSRISLVLELISSKRNSIPTLIFDEVDSGIGGETGDSVGELLKEIGLNNQLFVITHLPQVASKSKNHIIVKKNLKNSSTTQTIIEEIEGAEKVNEIARMLGGTKQISNESWQYAKKLIDGNQL